MSVNKYKDHVWVVPEDDANRQLANGFLLHPALKAVHMDIRPAPGGWSKVLTEFCHVHIEDLRRYEKRHLVLLIDFDEQVQDRARHFRDKFPKDVADRVYVLGASGEPEPLRKSVGCSLEKIGESLAEACTGSDSGLWDHEFLRHNRVELDRLNAGVKPFLFD